MLNRLGFHLSLTRKVVLTALLCLAMVCLLALIGLPYWFKRYNEHFTTTTSPQNTYSVILKGAKERPFVIPFTVKADVYKMGEPFAADVWLHTAYDAFDLSFESGYPEIRWPANNVVEFYRPQYFEDGSDVLIIQNRSGQPVKYLQIRTENKFLVLDIRPKASLSLRVPKPRSDWQWFAVEGVLSDGTQISRNENSFDRASKRHVDCTYLITIHETFTTVEPRAWGCS